MLNKNGNSYDAMSSLDYNRSSNYMMDSNDSLTSTTSEESASLPWTFEGTEAMPQFSIELGGGRQWWF